MKIFLILLIAVFLYGCAQYQPAISDVSDSAVKVQIREDLFTKPDMEAVNAEAARGCALYGKHATPLSARCAIFDGYGYCLVREFLFSCH